MVDLTDPIFTDADSARRHLEAQVWPNGPVCPHCGNADGARITALKGKSHRAGLYQCMECREQFTVTVGSVFERSKVSLNKWLLATYLLNSSKKGYSAHQLHRTIGVTYKTAWFMFHRIREAMKDDVTQSGPLGGEGKIVEADETYFGKVEEPKTTRSDGTPFRKGGAKGIANRRAVFALVERGGSSRMFHIEKANAATVRELLVTNACRESALQTDESHLYKKTGKEFSSHDTVNHSADEYVRREAEKVVTTNTIEGVFSIFKRGMVGIYQHCGEKHLHRYLAEFDHRYNHRVKLGFTDAMRADKALAGIKGKRLYYRRPDEAANA